VNKDVIISVKGSQASNYIDSEGLELITEGKYYKEGKSYFVTYNESEVTGMDGTTTTFKLDDGVVTLIRAGAVNSQFVFQQGKKHVSYYDTAYGAFTIGVIANEVSVNVDDNGGEIRVDYSLEIDNNKSGENDFHMFIREAGNSSDEFYRQYKK
jgi:uncharacterized beta-barrel protein YwiB (DUF1934 family)